MEPNSGHGRELGEGYRLMGLGCTFAGGVGMFLAGGWALDRWLGFTPVFTVTGALVGATLSFLSVYFRLQADTKAEIAERRRSREGRGKAGDQTDGGSLDPDDPGSES